MEEKIKPKSTVFAVITVQLIAMLLIAASVFALKFIYKPAYKKICAFYRENLAQGTDTAEFFGYFK